MNHPRNTQANINIYFPCHNYGHLIRKIMRRATEARGCKIDYMKEFFNYIEQFSWCISSYLALSQFFYLFWTILVYLGASLCISAYLSLYQSVPVYLRLSWSISDYLSLSWSISGFLILSRYISVYLGYLRLSWLSQAISA